MKQTQIAIISCVILLFQFSPMIARCDAIQDFYSEIDRIARVRDSDGALRLLVKLEATEIWSFGAGLGPTDSTSLQLALLGSSIGFICDEAAKQRLRSNRVDRVSNPKLERWISLLCAEPGDVETILNMIRDKSPAARWLGIEKAAGIIARRPEIREEVRHVAQTDPYVVFARVPKPWTATNAPRPNHLEANDVIAPLRAKAASVLRSATNEQIHTGNGLGDLGAARLMEAASARFPERKEDIRDAIHLLDGQSPVRSSIRGLIPRSEQELEAVKALKAADQTPRE